MELGKMEDETEMQKFYHNKTVFLTGGTGFLGKVYIEKILRVTNVNCIYILIRAKRGKNINERMDALLNAPLFNKLNKLKPDAWKRVKPIIGDCAEPDLGLTEEDRTLLMQHVEVVVHGAATVRFNEPLYNAIAINLRSTMDLLKLAKKMLKLQAFVHVSTAFANCLQPHIEERYYADKISMNAEQACKLIELLNADTVDRAARELYKGFPNTYSFTKALAEEAVLSHSADLPICIFRPAIVYATYEDPVCGWTDTLYGAMSITYGVAYGVLRVMYLNGNSMAAIVPVDFCANMMLVCAMHTAKTHNPTLNVAPTIYHLVHDQKNTLKWSEFDRIQLENGKEMPVSKSIWIPIFIGVHKKLLYTILCFFLHTIPGYIIDFILLLMGKKIRLTKIYQKMHKEVKLLGYFTETRWTFTMDNTRQLWESLTPQDKQLFNFNMTDIKWKDYLHNSLMGMRYYIAKEDPSTIPACKRRYKRLLILHRILQVIFYGGVAYLLIKLLQFLTNTF